MSVSGSQIAYIFGVTAWYAFAYRTKQSTVISIGNIMHNVAAIV